MKAVYIHIPFCVRKCLYCDFISGPPHGPVFPFVDSLKKEIERGSALFKDAEPVTSVFFGGGTPTVLSPEQLAEILDTVKRCFPVSDDAEISLECNPGTLRPGGAAVLRKASFNRVSLGLQSADARLLKLLGRIHSRDDFINAYAELRKAGFNNINVDVMHALPSQSIEQYIDTLRFVCALRPEHISSYALILEEGTPFHEMVQRGEIVLPDEDYAADMQDAGIRFLEENGYFRYEISNFARKGFACRHNLLYWNNGAYLGFGPAAHSSYVIDGVHCRWHNTNDTEDYIRRIEEGVSTWEEMTRIEDKEQRFETVMLGLRKTDGVDGLMFRNRFGTTVADAYPEATAYLLKNELLRSASDDYALNDRGLDLLNSVLLHFME